MWLARMTRCGGLRSSLRVRVMVKVIARAGKHRDPMMLRGGR